MADRWRAARKAADQTHALTSYADVADLAFPVEAGVKYHIAFHIGFQASAVTTGIGFAIAGPPNPTELSVSQRIMGVRSAATAGAFAADLVTAYDAGVVSTAVQTANTTYTAFVNCYIQPSQSGIVRLRVRAEIAAQVKVMAGSFGTLTVVV